MGPRWILPLGGYRGGKAIIVIIIGVVTIGVVIGYEWWYIERKKERGELGPANQKASAPY